ncbi:hypothetical protein ACNQGA_14950, partial [Flavobacterium sp. LB3R33]
VVYEICEVGANPINCKQATATILVENQLVAVADDFTGTPLTSGDATPSVVSFATGVDTLDGAPVVIGTNPGQVTLTGVTVPTQLTLDTATGIITVNANTPSGTYTLVYEICEVGAVPANCDTATVTILVENEIIATDDTFTTTPLTSNDTTPSVVLNDSLDGVTPVVIGTNPGEVTLTGVTVPSQLTLDTATGIITVNANTPSGTYTLVYEICEVGAVPANCDTATVTILVENEIIATDDTFTTTPLTSNDTTPSVVLNDSLDGVTPVVIGTNPGEVTLTGVTVPSQLTLDTATGIITVNANTPSGTYTLVYEICEVGAVPANCDTSTVTVVVSNPLVASNDTLPRTGGNVLGNDTVNGEPATVANTNVTPSSNGPLSIDADGNVTVAPNTPSGTYTLMYEICEAGATPTNCTTATVTIVITNPLVASNDTLPRTGG